MACQAIHRYILETSIWSAGMIKVKLVLYDSIVFTVEHQFMNTFVLQQIVKWRQFRVENAHPSNP